MPRPLFNYSYQQLETLFKKDGDTAETLTLLKDELVHRNTPKAKKLLETIQNRLKEANKSTPLVQPASTSSQNVGHGTSPEVEPVPPRVRLKTTLKKNGSVAIAGFGTFAVAKRASRAGRNPRTGAAIKIKAAKVPKFRPGKGLKDAM